MLLKVGDRVRVMRDMEIENYTIPTEGKLGSVLHIEFNKQDPARYIEEIYIKLDIDMVALDEWSNCLIWDLQGGCHPLSSIISDLELVNR